MFPKPLALGAAALLLAAATANAAPANTDDTTLPIPQRRFVDHDDARSRAVVLAARRYAAFWNTGDPAYARAALAADFADRTLPEGRAQGPDGPLQASRDFRAAVPDLKVEIADLVAAGDRVALRLHFTGRFTGRFGTTQGRGQRVDFQAFDLYRVENGRIAENWHLEDNLGLQRQLGVIGR
ncbi:putative ester cyclase [Lysobacter enzymogenes]|uniref:ester cyclase n=1 Tax=Lysobacter enzymogenes TaxID=69 RepID=UPI003392D021